MKDIVTQTLGIALRDSLPVKIIYDGGEEMTERVIRIIRIKDNRIVAYCRLKRRISTFKTDRILAAEVLYEKGKTFSE